MTIEAQKICPECSEQIQAQAQVCRYCGYDYRSGVRTVVAQTNGMAVASMVLGIIWLYWIGSILAIIFGMKAKRQIDEASGAQSGRGMAIAGIVLGWIGVATLLGFLLIFAIVSSVEV